MASHRSGLRITSSAMSGARVLVVSGVLDDSTYIPLRDTIVKAARDEPPAVIIDVTSLAVPDDSAWAVFTSARWQVAEWPDIAIGLVCAHARGRNAIRRNGITRYMPVCPTISSAVAELRADDRRRYRRRVRATLPPIASSSGRCRELTRQWLTSWSRTDFIHTVSVLATEMVEMALVDADRPFSLRMETDGATVTVAIQHASVADPMRRPDGDTALGMALVAATARVWGSYITETGTTVWAVVGPENRL